MKRLILPTLALLTILAVYTGCTENENEPVITRLHVAPQCGVAPVRVDVYGAASGGDESGPATGGANNLEYTWNFGDGTTSNTTIAYHVYETGGEYTVRLTVKDPGGKSDTDTVHVSVIADSMTIEATATPATSSPGERVVLDYRAISCAIDPDLAGDYRNLVQRWTLARTSTGDTIVVYDGKEPSHTFGSAGSYTAYLQVAFPAWSVVRRDTLYIDVN